MEALNFLRFWKPSNGHGTHKENQNRGCSGNSGSTDVGKCCTVVADHELDEGEESFIDLELPLHLHESDDKGNNEQSQRQSSNGHGEEVQAAKKRVDSKEERVLQESTNSSVSLSPNDHFSKRKIIPIEPNSKPPQSPIALLKSAPKFRVFTLNKSKSMANANNTYSYRAEKTELETPKHEKQGRSSSSKHLRVKFKVEEETPNRPTFTRDNSLRKSKGKTEESSSSKDLIQKYLNIIKPLYVKVSKKSSSQSDKARISGDLSMPSPAASPAAGARGVCKQLGKSRSASAAASPINRRDDSLLLQHDGIQSAILHCKRSFNASRAESSWLSRCTSDSSQEKLSNASSTDSSSHLSRVSNSSYEKLMDSARISSEEGSVFNTS